MFKHAWLAVFTVVLGRFGTPYIPENIRMGKKLLAMSHNSGKWRSEVELQGRDSATSTFGLKILLAALDPLHGCTNLIGRT